jgi:hypothetical protein
MSANGYVANLAARHTMETDTESKKPVALTKNAAPQDTSAHAGDDLNRPVGDWSVYKYYFSAVGHFNTALLMILLASFAFFLQFPGKPSSTNYTESQLMISSLVGKFLDWFNRYTWHQRQQKIP